MNYRCAECQNELEIDTAITSTLDPVNFCPVCGSERIERVEDDEKGGDEDSGQQF